MVSFVSHVTDVLRGAAMAVADSVPGVSGGTIAFLLGFYERFIWSVHALLLGNFAEKKAALPFLVKLGCGWVCCFLVCAVILSSLFDTYIYEICSVFLGLTIAAVPIVIAEEREALQGRYLNVVFAVIGVAIVPLLMSFAPSAGSTGVDLANGSFGLGLYLFVAAIVAVSAMVLPGISGSTLLLIMGLYVPLISAVSGRVCGECEGDPVLFCTVPVADDLFVSGAFGRVAVCDCDGGDDVVGASACDELGDVFGRVLCAWRCDSCGASAAEAACGAAG